METLQLKKKINNLFGLQIYSLKKLRGYDNENYLISCKNDNKYILKIYSFSKEIKSSILAENNCLNYLNKLNNEAFPYPVLSKNNNDYEIINYLTKKYVIRVLSYIKGKFLGELIVSENNLKALGLFLGNMSKNLLKYRNDTISSRRLKWDIQYLKDNKNLIKYINDSTKRKIILFFFQLFDEFVAPKINKLRRSIIHNDSNEWNILVNENKNISIIDFGDLTKSQLVNEVAVAMTYASYGKENPFKSACIILKNYYKIIKLTDLEISLLYYLIASKLCISVCNSAYSKIKDPSNKYALISENKAWNMLFKMKETNPMDAENEFRKAVNKKIIK